MGRKTKTSESKPTVIAKSKKKRGSIRKILLNDLIESQGNPVQLRETSKSVNDRDIEFIVQTAAKAQTKLIATNSSEYIKEANALVETLKARGHGKESCEFDVALVLKTITYTEDHPEPDDLGGIDLKVLYTTLAQMSMGYPTPELDGDTLLFLAECANDMRLHLKEPEQQNHIADMQTLFDNKTCPRQAPMKHDSSNELQSILNGKVLNPLGLSLPPLCTGNEPEGHVSDAEVS